MTEWLKTYLEFILTFWADIQNNHWSGQISKEGRARCFNIINLALPYMNTARIPFSSSSSHWKETNLKPNEEEIKK